MILLTDLLKFFMLYELKQIRDDALKRFCGESYEDILQFGPELQINVALVTRLIYIFYHSLTIISFEIEIVA